MSLVKHIRKKKVINYRTKCQNASRQFCDGILTLNMGKKTEQNMQKRFVNNIQAYIHSKHSVKVLQFLTQVTPFPHIDDISSVR